MEKEFEIALQDNFIVKFAEVRPLTSTFLRILVDLSKGERKIPNKEECAIIKMVAENNFLYDNIKGQYADIETYLKKSCISGILGYYLPILTTEQFAVIREIVYNIIDDPEFYNRA